MLQVDTMEALSLHTSDCAKAGYTIYYRRSIFKISTGLVVNLCTNQLDNFLWKNQAHVILNLFKVATLFAGLYLYKTMLYFSKNEEQKKFPQVKSNSAHYAL